MILVAPRNHTRPATADVAPGGDRVLRRSARDDPVREGWSEPGPTRARTRSKPTERRRTLSPPCTTPTVAAASGCGYRLRPRLARGAIASGVVQRGEGFGEGGEVGDDGVGALGAEGFERGVGDLDGAEAGRAGAEDVQNGVVAHVDGGGGLDLQGAQG